MRRLPAHGSVGGGQQADWCKRRSELLDGDSGAASNVHVLNNHLSQEYRANVASEIADLEDRIAGARAEAWAMSGNCGGPMEVTGSVTGTDEEAEVIMCDSPIARAGLHRTATIRRVRRS